jgi:hypothetical protein
MQKDGSEGGHTERGTLEVVENFENAEATDKDADG